MSLILDLIFPKKCYGCGKTGEYLCRKCQNHIHILNTTSPKDGFDGGLSLFKYDSAIKSAILDLKYNFVFDNALALTTFMANKLKLEFPNLLNNWQKNNFILTPIPLYSSRQKWRGFNQSEILAKNLAKKLSLKFSDEVLVRDKNTQVQARLKNIKERANNVSNIFSLHQSSGQFKQGNFIIFDDVSTTKSTLISAEITLKDLPLNQCWYLTLSVG